MILKSPTFRNGEAIPEKYSRLGADINPPLEIEGAPEDSRSLALIMEDPDAPSGLFVHWIVVDLGPGTMCIPEDFHPQPSVHFGKNGWGEIGYGGPKPPSGEHRYRFRIYALDTRLGLPSGANREEVETAMRDHVVDSAVLTGRYSASR